MPNPWDIPSHEASQGRVDQPWIVLWAVQLCVLCDEGTSYGTNHKTSQGMMHVPWDDPWDEPLDISWVVLRLKGRPIVLLMSRTPFHGSPWVVPRDISWVGTCFMEVPWLHPIGRTVEYAMAWATDCGITHGMPHGNFCFIGLTHNGWKIPVG